MNLARSLLLSLAAVLSFVLCAQGADPTTHFVDEFSSAEVPERRAMRGDWIIEEGIAKCTQDDALYKKYKDHGPIIFYNLAFSDCLVKYQYKPEGCQNVVFTINGEAGHVFRIVTGSKHSDFRLFPPDSDTKSIAARRVEELAIQDGVWTDVEVHLQGTTATIKIGDSEPIVVTHDSLAGKKTNVSVGFAFGTLSVQGFSVDYQ